MIRLIKYLFSRPSDCPQSDWLNLQVFAALLFMQLFNAYSGLLLNGSNSMSLAILGLAIVICGYCSLRQLNSTDVMILLCTYGFFVLNFVKDPSLGEYFFNSRMMSVYMLYLPAGVCIVRKIQNWNYFFRVCRIYCLLSVFIAFDAVLTVDTVIYANMDFFSYMAYSYMMLPFILSAYVLARREKSLIWLAVFFVLYVSIISYGARNAVALTPLFICCYEMLTGSLTKRIIMAVILLIIVVAFYFFIDKIMYALSLLPIFENSRLITRFMAKTITSGGERDLLISEGVRQLMHMEMEVPGLFGDRKYVNGIYPHNIILETMLQFGWILGILFNLFLLYIAIYSILFSRNKVMGFYLFFALFGKLFVSDSYIMSMNFWLWLFGALSLCDKRGLRDLRLRHKLRWKPGKQTDKQLLPKPVEHPEKAEIGG